MLDPACIRGAKKGPTNKRSGDKQMSETDLSSRHYKVCAVRAAKFKELNIDVKGFKPGKRNYLSFIMTTASTTNIETSR